MSLTLPWCPLRPPPNGNTCSGADEDFVKRWRPKSILAAVSLLKHTYNVSEKDLKEDGNTELDYPFFTRRRGYCARRPCEGSNPWANVKGGNSTTESVLLVLCSWINGRIYKITYYLKNVHRVLTANSKQVSGVLVATWTKRINLSWMYEFKVHSCSWQERVLILCYLLHSL